jgi:phosphorylase kinase alpha/beta subunit
MRSLTWHNSTLKALVPKGSYHVEDIERIEKALKTHRTLVMRPFASGLFPAAALPAQAAKQTGYGRAWVRDNVLVAHAYEVQGKPDVAARTARALLDYFWAHRRRFEAIIAHDADPNDVMQRPHIRFDGKTLQELPQPWPHAQNDALGYALWLFARLAARGYIPLDAQVCQTLSLFPQYFDAIRYWEDEDSGHWEETRKISASSIGTVVAGLEALLVLSERRSTDLRFRGFGPGVLELTNVLITHGRAALAEILPSECVQPSPQQRRCYDAALLFLVYPLEVVSDFHAESILFDINRYLAGDVGVRRYLGDSYWAPDYDQHLRVVEQTRDFSEDVSTRDRLLDQVGHEAQWCVFDPILSAAYGRRYRRGGSESDLRSQVLYFHRSLAQITRQWQLPELYYLRHRVYTPNPHTPLLWSQANLAVALAELRASLAP